MSDEEKKFVEQINKLKYIYENASPTIEPCITNQHNALVAEYNDLADKANKAVDKIDELELYHLLPITESERVLLNMVYEIREILRPE